MYLEDVMDILQQSVQLFNFNTRVLLTFKALDIETIKDLLVEIKVHKAYHFKCYICTLLHTTQLRPFAWL